MAIMSLCLRMLVHKPNLVRLLTVPAYVGTVRRVVARATRWGQSSASLSEESKLKSTNRTDHIDAAELDSGADRLGIIPRAISAIFDRLSRLSKDSRGGFTFQLKNSYIELYNEDLIGGQIACCSLEEEAHHISPTDLLASDAGERPQVTIREDKHGTIIWTGLREVKVTNAMDVMS